MSVTRRDFGRLMVGVWPLAHATRSLAAQGRPDSRVSGVQIGLNVPYNFGNNLLSADETLQRCVSLGISAVELRSQPVELALGLPRAWLSAAANPPASARTPERLAAQQEALAALRQWRTSLPMARARQFRRRWQRAGVAIQIVKFDGIYSRADDELDYCFNLAKALGARALSCEIDHDGTARVGQFAAKHQLMVGYHGHTETGPADWIRAFGQSEYNGANVDIGHFIIGNPGASVTDFLKAHHDRVTHLHIKDRRKSDTKNVAFGQGDTPIVEVLRLVRDERWNMQATIEFEYDVPAGSDRMLEMARCIDYCRRALA